MKVADWGQLTSKSKDTRPDAMAWRWGCATCGGVFIDDKATTMGLMMVPAGLSQKPFKPALHVFYQVLLHDQFTHKIN